MHSPRFNSIDEVHTWIDARKRHSQPQPRTIPTEEQEQIALLDWVRNIARRQWPELPDLLHHVPNGGFRRKHEAVIFTQLGVLSGIPDLHLPMSRHGHHSLYIEMKALDGVPSETQLRRACCLAIQGNVVAFCWGWEMGRDVVLWYLEKD